MNTPYRPVHRERLHDADEHQRGPAPGQQFQQGQGGFAAGTGPQGSTPGDFRHGGLGTPGHVPQAPHALHRQQDEPDWSQLSQGAPQFAGPGSDAAAWGHVPRAPHAGGQHAGQGSAPQEEFDPEYLQWREEHLRGLDEDYRAWRQQRFADEFSRWRARSPGGSS
ncbi:hypothetical protein [Azohydromonas caseinilytica]|uniref:Uncharacterized protein n=1 Tax=Azohydromonas caseinilytica TaxID=2728836 RepID=A0A848FLB6_9BURK|nr:hypothetical protein [Azohydromonas caseinilytica]NML18591.1 hypothetical protein [Azohydromonas caseinilytica]